MNENIYQTYPLAFLPPHNKHDKHELIVSLLGNDDTRWAVKLILGLQPASSSTFVIIELPVAARQGGGRLNPLSDQHSELSIELAGPAAPVKVTNLSETPMNEWVAAMDAALAECPSAVVLLVNRGHITLTLYEGGEI